MALLAHKRAVRVHHEDSELGRRVTARATASCQDDPAGWKSSAGNDCQTYVEKEYCTPSGGYGNGWWRTFWGDFSDYAVAGKDATTACCGCGGGKLPLCRADEASGVERVGVSLLFVPSGDTCNAATCTPRALLKYGLQETQEAVPLGSGACGCWALDGTGGRIFLFSWTTSTCTARSCWQKYVRILQIFRWGLDPRYEGGVPLTDPADNLYNEHHWTTTCSGSGRAHALGLAPVSQLISSLQIWGELDKMADILNLVSLDPSGGGLPPLQTEEIVAGLLRDRSSLPYNALEWVLKRGGQVASFFGKEDGTTLLGSFFGNDYYHWLYVLGARRTGSYDQALQWFLELPPGKGTTRQGPGPNTTSFYSWREVKALMEALGGLFERGMAQRQNQLGLIILNTVMWPEAPGGRRSIALGASVESHALIRPLIADVLDNARGGPECDGSSCWSPEWLQSRARAWLEKRTAFTSGDLGAYNAAILWKVHLNLDFSEEEAKAFYQYVRSVLVVIVLTERQAGNWLIRKALNIPEVQAKRAAYLKMMRPAFLAKFKHVKLSEFELEAALAAFLDSMQFAGTVSVPSALRSVLALTHRKESEKWEQLKGLSLDASNIDAVLWETLRMYPPVLGFPYWEQVDGKWEHKMPVLNMALLDGEVYHNPTEFILRPLKFYEKHSIGFSDFAVHPPGDITAESIRAPHSRRCPAKDLALEIMRTFLKEFVALGPWWSQGGKDIRVGAKPGSFTLEREPTGCWAPPQECASDWLYKLRRYKGCATVDNNVPWCSHHSIYVHGQFSECKREPCESAGAQPDEPTDPSEVLALAALEACKFGSSGSPKEIATCVCQRANLEPRVMCKELSTVAMELSSPWSCTLRKQEGREECVAYSPWYLQAPKQIAHTWKSVKHWGQSYVGTDRCYTTNDKCCAQSALATVSVKCSEITMDTFANDWLDLPKQLQGIYWLQDQGINSALVSFGRTRDGCGFTPGRVNSDGSYRVRTGGDRSWSFATTQGGAFRLSQAADGVYQFFFDSPTNPTTARVLPTARILFGATVPPFFVEFNLTLVTSYPPYPESVVWRRDSSILSVPVETKKYHIIQVIDGSGHRLPAFNDFLRHCEDPESSGSTSPGFIWFNRYDGDAAEVVEYREAVGECSGLAGFVLPGVFDFGLAVANGPFFHLDKHVNGDLDRDVLGDYGYLSLLAGNFGALIPFSGRYDPPATRLCVPQAARPLRKLLVQGTNVPLEELDEGGVCESGAGMTKATWCAFAALERLEMDDDLESGNTWQRALKGKRGTTKEEWVMALFDYTNGDGESIYPAQVIDYRSLYYRDGLWEDAMEAHLALDMIGTHLVQEVRGPAPSRGGETAALVLRLNAFAGFELRQGFAPWGGDMYFSASGKVLMVELATTGGKTEQVWADSDVKRWQYAKWVFRASLVSAVTVVDHLWFVHLTSANAMAAVAREHLLPEHPLRRLLSAATLNSIKVNTDAATTLLGRRQLLHRITPFVDWQAVHSAGEDFISTLEGYFGPMVNASKMAALHPLLKEAPFYKDGAELYGAWSGMIDRFFGLYGEEWCSAESDLLADQGLLDYAKGMEAFLRHERSSRAEANLAWLKGSNERAWTCAALKKLLKCYLFAVSGFHQHVGKVADYFRDPELAGGSWVEGEATARPRHAVLAAVVSANTGFIGVKLREDLGFIFAGLKREAQLKEVMKQFNADLEEVGRTIDSRNQKRSVPYIRMLPSEAEISVFQ